MRKAREPLGGVRANAAFRLWEDGADPDAVIDELARFEMTSRARAQKAVEFLLHPIWRSYILCYVEGLAICRAFVGGDPARFSRLVTEQLTPARSDRRACAGAISRPRQSDAGHRGPWPGRSRTIDVVSERSRNLPRRSCLSVPGSNLRFLEKAPAVKADMTILDLEDSVAPAEKAVSQGEGGRRDPQPRLG